MKKRVFGLCLILVLVVSFLSFGVVSAIKAGEECNEGEIGITIEGNTSCGTGVCEGKETLVCEASTELETGAKWKFLECSTTGKTLSMIISEDKLGPDHYCYICNEQSQVVISQEVMALKNVICYNKTEAGLCEYNIEADIASCVIGKCYKARDGKTIVPGAELCNEQRGECQRAKKLCIPSYVKGELLIMSPQNLFSKILNFFKKLFGIKPKLSPASDYFGKFQKLCDKDSYKENNPAYESEETTCDGLDNDCDGSIDDNCIEDLEDMS